MSVKNDYTPEEWELIRKSLAHPGLLIMAVSPQGEYGTARESGALVFALGLMLQTGAGYELIDDLRHDRPTQFDPETIDPGKTAAQSETVPLEAMRARTLDLCRQVSGLLSRKAAESEADYLRRGVVWVCKQVAEAAKEGGGLFGVGSKQVTDEEQNAIDQIAAAFDLPPEAARSGSLPPAPVRPVPRVLEGIYTPDEWRQVKMLPIQAAMTIALISPSGPVGLTQEMLALAQAVRESLDPAHTVPLISTVVEDLSVSTGASTQNANPAEASNADELYQMTLAAARRVRMILAAHANEEEGLAYRRWIAQIARRVAEAAREDTFLGFGGAPVNDKEAQALQDIRRALGVEE
jgi:hypothetical protein